MRLVQIIVKAVKISSLEKKEGRDPISEIVQLKLHRERSNFK